MSKEIAIIGAGFTGLTAAYDLSKKGHKVRIYEATDRAGGLVAGFKMNGVPLEMAYHFLYKTDKDIQQLLEELGIRDKLEFHDSSISTYYDGVLYPLMKPLDLLKFKPLGFFDRIRAGLVVLYLQFRKDWEDFRYVTAYDWMKKYAGKNVVRVIWEPLLKGKFDKYYDKVAMTFLWSRIQVRALSKEKGDSTEKLGYIKGGWVQVINRLVEEIEKNGGEIIYNSKVSDIHREDDDGRISFKLNGDQLASADALLSTTPSPVFSKIVDNKQYPVEYLDKLNSIDYLGAVLMVFSSDQEFTPYYWHNINDTDKPFLVLINLTALIGKGAFNGKNVYYIGDYVPHEHEYFQQSDEQIKEKWISALEEIFPDMDRTQIDESYIFKFKNAQHIVGVDFANKMVPFETPVKGVYLSNFTQIYPDDRGTNYAVRDGRRVAMEVMRYLDLGTSEKPVE